MPPADGEAQRAGTSLLGVNLPRFAVASLGGAAGAPLFGGLAYELSSHDSAKRLTATRPRYGIAPTLPPGSRGTVGMGVALNGTWN
ncbi:hypothetical protein ACLEPN_23525 [Myxococcus sp. 1LA]